MLVQFVEKIFPLVVLDHNQISLQKYSLAIHPVLLRFADEVGFCRGKLRRKGSVLQVLDKRRILLRVHE